MGLLNTMSGERGIGGDVGGRWDVGIIGSSCWVEAPVDSKLDRREAMSASDRFPASDFFAAKRK